jgi:hypothetical protein
MTDPRFFRQYLDILNEAPPAPAAPAAAAPTAKPFAAPTPAATPPAPQPNSAATPVTKQVPQGSMSNMPGAQAYSAAADPMAATNAQYQQNMQNISAERGQRFQDHMAARDAATQKYGSVTNALKYGDTAYGPSGDLLQRSSVDTTDLKQKERQAGQEYTAANREKTGGGHWQYDKKTVDSAMGPITQTSARRIATPTKGEVIRQGLAGGGSLYDRRSTLLDPNAPPPPPGATGLNPTGAAQPTGPAIQSATTDQPVQEDELVRLRELLKR